ncbi:MAG: glycosyltransferase [Gemmatimonadota bacterium]|nr:glycosyltransferase [Gemmatimonadota bacterium]
MPSVSVITTFLNAERFIHDAVQSVLAQTYENWELLLVDDGSSDASTAIAKSYAERYPTKVSYLEHDEHRNKGMSASRNLGILAARSDFVAFLDADDVWLADKLARQTAILERHADIGLVFNPAIYWREDGNRTLQPIGLSKGRIPARRWIPSMLRYDDNAACPSTVLMKRDLALLLGGFEESFRDFYQIYEDQVMWCKVSMNSHIYYDPEPVALYRIHSSSWCGSASADDRLLARIGFCAWLNDYLHVFGKGRLLATMAQCRLVEALLHKERRIDHQLGLKYFSRVRRRLRAMVEYQGRLGNSLSALVIVGGVSHLLALALSRSVFLVCHLSARASSN